MHIMPSWEIPASIRIVIMPHLLSWLILSIWSHYMHELFSWLLQHCYWLVVIIRLLAMCCWCIQHHGIELMHAMPSWIVSEHDWLN